MAGHDTCVCRKVDGMGRPPEDSRILLPAQLVTHAHDSADLVEGFVGYLVGSGVCNLRDRP